MKIFNNMWVKYIVILFIGVTIGSIFYPSKSITREEVAKYEAKIEKVQEEKREAVSRAMSVVNEKSEQHKEFKRESEHKISSLRTENTHLKQKTKERIVKIIKPDGTITEEIVRESDTEVVSQIVTDIKQEFNEKVSSIEKKWKTIHTKRVTTIRDTYEKKLAEKQHIVDEYSKKETIKINERKFGISLGYTSYDKYFSSISYDMYGPFFLDLHIESNKGFSDTGGGIGIGFRF